MQFNKKGQAWSLDFIMMSMILIAILFTIIYSWNFISIRWNNITVYNRQYVAGLILSESLVSSSGNPPSWEYLNTTNTSTLIQIGLTNERNKINTAKLDRLNNLSLQNYSFVKQVLGIQNYEFFINVSNLDRNVTLYSIGNITQEFNDTVSFERVGLYNDSIVFLRVEVWK